MVNWETRKLTWRYDWAWLTAYAVAVVGFLTWTVLWRHKIVFDEVAALAIAIAAVNLVRGWLIVRADRGRST